jgi:ketosteroid isomerase-like protein
MRSVPWHLRDKTMRNLMVLGGLLFWAVACSPSAPPGTTAIAETAHTNYVDAINSNNPEMLAKVLTDDVVYQAPHEPEIIGKAAVRKWVEGYFGAYSAKWEKTTLDFIVNGDWAFERYAYKSTDTPKDGGSVLTDEGKGLNVYHKDADGVWRVARDSWSSNRPIPTR